MSKVLCEYLGSKNYWGDSNTKFHYYSIDYGATGYVMGLEILDDKKAKISATLFHWENDEQKKTLEFIPSNTEKYSRLKVYEHKKGRFFMYLGKRIYLPNQIKIVESEQDKKVVILCQKS